MQFELLCFVTREKHLLFKIYDDDDDKLIWVLLNWKSVTINIFENFGGVENISADVVKKLSLLTSINTEQKRVSKWMGLKMLMLLKMW